MTVSAILHAKGSDVATVPVGTTISQVADEMARRKIGCIVVLTRAEGTVTGIISERDIVAGIARDGAKALAATVETYMTRNVIHCRQADTAEHLMTVMTERRFRHLPVVEDDRLCGIISIGDVVKVRLAEAELESQAMRDYIATG